VRPDVSTGLPWLVRTGLDPFAASKAMAQRRCGFHACRAADARDLWRHATNSEPTVDDPAGGNWSPSIYRER